MWRQSLHLDCSSRRNSLSRQFTLRANIAGWSGRSSYTIAPADVAQTRIVDDSFRSLPGFRCGQMVGIGITILPRTSYIVAGRQTRTEKLTTSASFSTSTAQTTGLVIQ